MGRAVLYLLRFCSEHRLEKKYFVVPFYQVGHQIGEALAKEGGNWVNLTAGAKLSKPGVKFISSNGSFFLVDKIFRTLKAAKKLK